MIARAGATLEKKPLVGVAFASLVAFVVVLLVQHIVDPGLDPLRHMISEYANGPAGWLMVAGFLAWSCSLLATGAIVGHTNPDAFASVTRALVAAALVIAGVGMLVTAVCRTQTSAGLLPHGVHLSRTGRLHDIGSGAATLALVIAAALSAIGIRSPGWFRSFTVTLLIGLALTVTTLPLAAEGWGGLRQRLLVLAACVWQMALLRAVAVDRPRLSEPEVPRGGPAG